MMKHSAFLLLIATCACNTPTSTPEAGKQEIVVEKEIKSETADSSISTALASRTSEFPMASGKVIVVEESHPKGASLSSLKVMFKDDPASAFPLEDTDPVNKILSADLDADGFGEIYIITTAAGSGSYGKVYGFASLKDKSLGTIAVPEPGEKDIAKGGQFEGYEGHDEFEIVENSLVRQFPIKSEKAKYRSVNYKLKKGEASYQLWIKNSTAF